MARVFVGTSGFFYSHWGKGVFYPPDLPQHDWFLYYTRQFDTVELNVSFYRLPKKETFTNWRERAGKNFVFSVKGSRFITHIKRLKDCQEPVKRFFEAASGLGCGWVVGSESGCENEGGIRKRKLTPTTHPRPTTHNSTSSLNVVLWQLPPRFKVNSERLTEFLKILPKNWRYAFEFRNESWLTDEIYKILKKHKAAIVFQDNPGWPITEKITADFAYLRFHGRTSLYSSCYTENELKDWAKKIRSWQKRGLDCYAYFNNDALGYAVENAQTLKNYA